ncbi:MAG: hypothetical protein HOP23_01585 [Methylococcaceae bacterium]|nr:hypothetical protein [Methylococcaceae bacterium]
MTSRHQYILDGLFSATDPAIAESRNNYLLILCCAIALLLTGCFTKEKLDHKADGTQSQSHQSACDPNTAPSDSNTVTAEVVALEQIITYNRFGAFNPAGMVYALKKDVVDENGEDLSSRTESEMVKLAGKVRLRDNKRPRPLVLRVNECNYLKVKFWNLLSPLPTLHSTFQRPDFPKGGIQRHAVQTIIPEGASQTDLSSPPRDPQLPNSFPFPSQEEPDYPTTRAASIHANGLDYVPIKPQICHDPEQNKIIETACKNTGKNMGADGANVGKNANSLVEPGKFTIYQWLARQEGGYFMYSAGALAGGEGDGGQLGLGLFGSINVEPAGSKWYRSQVTYDDLKCLDDKSCEANYKNGHPYSDLDYQRLAILNDDNEIVHSDLNAIIYQPNTQSGDRSELMESGLKCSEQSPGSSCGMSFREFTTIFHDENKVFQAFAELSDEGNPVSAIADGMAINYGSSGVGSAVLASKKSIGPAKDCKDCKLEEFFLSSWANGDPAMIVRRDIHGKAVAALYPDDPSNVHHAYLGDPVRFRNIHAGPKETHVFHLHAHQWLQDKNDPNANYLDSQTISPGSSYTYDIQYGGGGNRNLTVGDAIFHCHLYPHFAAGMWELWRNHDVFEDGKPGLFDVKKNPDPRVRNLPDHEIEGGTPNPAIVPIPGAPLAPLPTAEFRGYPFFIAGVPGHRPPQPPLDMARDNQGKELNGGLPRHVITDARTFPAEASEMQPDVLLDEVGDQEENKAARYIAKRTWKLNSDKNNVVMAAKLKSATLKMLPQCGTQDELFAMAFHAGWNKSTITGLKQGIQPDNLPDNIWQACKDEFKAVLVNLDDSFQWKYQAKATEWPMNRKTHDPAMPTLKPMIPLWKGLGYETAKSAYPDDHGVSTTYDPGNKFRVNGFAPAPGAPFADPCPTEYYNDTAKLEGPGILVNRLDPRIYKSAYIQFDMTVNKYGWHDPQARMPVLEEDAANTINGTRLAEPLFFRANSGDCIQFQATNLIPSVLNLDDFQIYTPTDTIGQHIHLVKFDVTSSDGSANGWNYEDGTFSPDEVRERIEASKQPGGSVVQWNNQPHKSLEPMTYRLPSGNSRTRELGQCSTNPHENNKKHPWCGAQTTVQRWWADPVLNDQWKDRTMRAVFTHDHYGPSSHQQHGFYAALIVEPKDSVWTQLSASPEKVVKPVAGKSILDCSRVSSAIGNKALGGALNGKPAICADRQDGGPTSYAANIGFIDKASNVAKNEDVRREYNLAFADFAILYNADMRPVNPPSRQADLLLPHVVRDGLKPKPEGISTEDPGTRLLNYRNEPIPLRIAEEDSGSRSRNIEGSLEYKQKTECKDFSANPAKVVDCPDAENANDNILRVPTGPGDMSNVFSSIWHSNTAFDGGKPSACHGSASKEKQKKYANIRFQKLTGNAPNEVVDAKTLKALLQQTENDRCEFVDHLYSQEPWRNPGGGDPSTPVLATYIGEPLKLHLIQGAQEEQHVFSMTGMKWLAEPASPDSGYMNGQQIGISEHFEFDVPVPSGGTNVTDYWYGSPAVENLWDGMWGLVRSYGFTSDNKHQNINLTALERLPQVEPPPLVAGELSSCPEVLSNDKQHHKNLFVGVWLASDLLKTSNSQGRLVYNSRFDISDPNAIIFVQQDNAWREKALAPEAILQKLQDRYQSGKKVEPLVLRVNAGDCVTVHFVNYLPENMAGKDGPDVRQSWSYNLLPPIVNGFNFNQIQSSSWVGLQPQLLTFSANNNDGANIGFNSCNANVSTADGQTSCKNPLPALSRSMPKPCKKTLSGAFGDCRPKAINWYAGDVKFSKQKPLAANGLDVTERDDISENEFKKYDYYVESFSANGETGWAQYTPIEYGAVNLRDFGDTIKHSSHGAIGAVIVEPRDATWMLPETNPLQTQMSTKITLQDSKQSFHEFVLLMQDDLSLQQHKQPMPNHRMADDAEDTGQKGFNYATEPLWARNGVGTSGADFNVLNQVDYTHTLSAYKNIAPCGQSCDPQTPIFEAPAGADVRFRVVHPGGHSRQHAFVLHGHNWDYQPWANASTKLTDADNKEPRTARIGAIGGIGPSRHVNILAKAGGKCEVPGDYLFRVQEQFQFQGGMWGIFRVSPTERGSKC